MDLQLTDKLAPVSGSTAGTGLAIATSLAAEGTRVIVNGCTAARVAEAVSAASPLSSATTGAALRVEGGLVKSAFRS